MSENKPTGEPIELPAKPDDFEGNAPYDGPEIPDASEDDATTEKSNNDV